MHLRIKGSFGSISWSILTFYPTDFIIEIFLMLAKSKYDYA
jgi:hypothetical protein